MYILCILTFSHYCISLHGILGMKLRSFFIESTQSRLPTHEHGGLRLYL